MRPVQTSNGKDISCLLIVSNSYGPRLVGSGQATTIIVSCGAYSAERT